MKIHVIDSDYSEWTYEGEDLHPVVVNGSERLDIVDAEGRILASFPHGNWYAFQADYDNQEEPTPSHNEEEVSAEAIGAAYVDVIPRVKISEDSSLTLSQVMNQLNALGIEVIVQ